MAGYPSPGARLSGGEAREDGAGEIDAYKVCSPLVLGGDVTTGYGRIYVGVLSDRLVNQLPKMCRSTLLFLIAFPAFNA